jgi:hypothetical protein
MRTCHRLSAHVAPAITSLATFCIIAVAIAACGETAESERFLGQTTSLAWCSGDASCGEDSYEPDVPSDWLVRCTSDAECAIGQCVCGLCTEPCTADGSDTCAGVPEGAACFAGGTTAWAALCRSSTVPGICLPPCEAGDDCGEGYICALGACLPEPPAH